MPSIADLFISVSSDVSGAITGLTDVDKKVNGVASSMTAAAPAGYALAGAAAAVGAGFLSSIDVAADFQHQMSAVNSVLALEQVAQYGGALADLALTLGKDTVFSASQAASAIEELVKAGVPVEDVMNGGAAAALSLASATGIDVSQAANFAGTALNTFHLTAEQLTHTVDTLAGVANASAADIGDLQFAFAAVGPVAASLGLSFDDTAIALGAFADNGLRGSDAGTSLKTMLLNLEPSTKAQVAAFQQLGLLTVDYTAATDKLTQELMSTEAGQRALSNAGKDGTVTMDELFAAVGKLNPAFLNGAATTFAYAGQLGGVSNAFFDATGSAKSMSDIFEILKTSTANLTNEQKINLLQTAFGTDAVRAAAIAAEEGAAGFDKLAASVGQISAADAAKTRLDNLNGSLSQLGGSFETVQITIGNMFLPALRGIVDAATGVLNAFLTLDPTIQMILASILGLAGIIAAAGAAFVLLGPMVIAAGAAFGVLAAAISPVILPILAVSAAAAALYLAWQTDFAGIRESTESTVTAIQPLLDNLKQFFIDMQPVVTVIGQIIGAYLTPAFVVLEAVLRPLLAVLGPLIGLLGDFFNFLSPIRDLLIAIINPVVGLTLAWNDNFLGMRDAVNAVIATLTEFWDTLASGNVGGAAQAVFNGLSSAIQAVWGWIQQLLSGNFTTGLFGLTEDSPAVRCFQGLQEALSNLIPLIQSVFGQIPTILGTLNNVWDVFINATWALGTRIGEALGSLLSYISQVVQGQLPNILANLGDPWAGLVNGAWDLGQRIGEALGSLLGFIGEDLGTALPGVIDAVGDIWANLVNGTWDLGQRIGEALGSLLGFIGEELGTALPGVINAVGDVWAIFVGGAWDLGTRIGEALGNMLGFIGVELGEALPGVIDGIGDVWAGFVGAAWELGNRIPDAINNVLGFIGAALASIPDMINGLGDIWSVLVDGAIAIVARIGDVLNPIKQVIIDIFGALPAWFTGQFGGGTTDTGGTGGTGTTGTYAPLINIGTLIISSQEEANAFLDLVAQAVLASANRVTVPTGGANPVL